MKDQTLLERGKLLTHKLSKALEYAQGALQIEDEAEAKVWINVAMKLNRIHREILDGAAHDSILPSLDPSLAAEMATPDNYDLSMLKLGEGGADNRE